MNDDGLRALREVRFDWALMEEDVWAASPFHVDGLHETAKDQVRGGIDAADRSTGSNPIGLVVEGDKGTGKTHLLGWAREEVQARGGYFFLVGVHEGSSFWENVLIGIVNGLLRPMQPAGGDDQLRVLLRRLADWAGVPAEVAAAVAGDASLTPAELDAFGAALQRRDRLVGRECQDVARALALYASDDTRASLVGDSFLHGTDDDDEARQRSLWGLQRRSKTAELTVRDIFRLLALTGPSVVAVDQIDGLLATSLNPVRRAGATEGDAAAARLLDEMATGLMGLHNAARRSLTVVACLASSWAAITARGFASASQRFRSPVRLGLLPSPEVAAELVAKRLGAIYGPVGFTPPHATWPVAPGAFTEAPEYTPRALLMRIDTHIQACLATGRVTELAHFGPGAALPGAGGRLPGGLAAGPGAGAAGGLAAPDGGAGRVRLPAPASAADLGALDQRFAELRRRADVTAAFDPRTEDDVMPGLLRAGLEAWVIEQGANAAAFTIDPPPGPSPPCTPACAGCSTRRSSTRPTGRSGRSWPTTPSQRSTGSAPPRRRRACSTGRASGTSRCCATRTGRPAARPSRRSTGSARPAATTGRSAPRTSARSARSPPCCARATPGSPPGWSTGSPPPRPSCSTWCWPRPSWASRTPNPSNPSSPSPARARSPIPRSPTVARSSWSGRPPARPAPAGRAGATAPELPFADPAPARVRPSHPAPATATATSRPARPSAAPSAPATAPVAEAPAVAPGHVVLGRAAVDGAPVPVALRDLTKHAVIFAGSGSGKTVLIRRLIEDCALAGVSSIVLDPNNDLARLGDPWPQPPAGWAAGDAARAEEYLATTDVVVWTPGRAGGRPLTFQPLPDFASVLDDPDEFTQAVEAALASLAPRAQVDGSSSRALQHRAVLRQALEAFGRGGGGGLAAFLQMLADLPDGVSDLDDAPRVAAALAQTLRAVRIVDPLFGGIGQAADPGVLLTPPPGKRARVSVVNFVGLADEAARQGFVNQLQMALFAWLKRHPHPSLGGLLVMDEAQTLAPSGAMTPCTQSSIVLASQARKYGLGLVFATQAVTGLHNRIASNAATQVLGRMNAPAQITAARGLAQAKGGDVPDIARLGHGHFYVALEGRRYQKVSTAMCLSHHPPNPLTGEEVVARAAGTAAG